MKATVRRFFEAHWATLVIVASVSIFLILATTVIWPVRGPTIISRVGVATLTRDGQAYYCFWLGENQYNDTMFPSEVWANGEVVLVPVPIKTYMATISTGNVTVSIER